MAAPRSNISNIPEMLMQRYDLDDLRIYPQPHTATVGFDITYLGERRSFVMNERLLDSLGEQDGTRAIRSLIEGIVAGINDSVIDLRRNALEGLSDVKILIDRTEEEHPGNSYPIIVTPDQADYLLATSPVRDYIINDPKNALLFGHPFRVKAVPNA